jgi:hypothetical protein
MRFYVYFTARIANLSPTSNIYANEVKRPEKNMAKPEIMQRRYCPRATILAQNITFQNNFRRFLFQAQKMAKISTIQEFDEGNHPKQVTAKRGSKAFVHANCVSVHEA